METTEAMRERILRLVRTYPGLHLRELARQADTSLNLVQYHIQRLHDEDKLDISLEGGKVRVFSPELAKQDRRAVACLRDRKRLQVAMALLDAQPQSHGALATALKLGKSTLSFHLRQMEEDGLLQSDGDGYALRDPARIKHMLDSFPPTPDAADRLADVWRRVYGE